MLLVLYLLVHGVGEEAFEGEVLTLSIRVHGLGEHKVGSNITSIISEHVSLFDHVELIDEFLQSAIALFDSSFKGLLLSLALLLCVPAS